MMGALLIGLAGSLHCVGMCGPITLVFQRGLGHASFVWYHAGRVLMYSLIGVVFGALGQAVTMLTFQRVFSVGMGVVIVLLYAIPSTRKFLEQKYYQSAFYQRVSRSFRNVFSSSKNWFFAGMANGLLPCGLIYLAMAGAIISNSAIQGGLFMAVFALGTLPALIAFRILGNSLEGRWKKLFPGFISAVSVMVGLLLIFRGLTSYPDMTSMVQAAMLKAISVCGF
jgi:uncharacterized protein